MDNIPRFDNIMDGYIQDKLDIYYFIHRCQPFQAHRYMMDHMNDGIYHIFRGNGYINPYIMEYPDISNQLRIDISHNIPPSEDARTDPSLTQTESEYIEW